MAEPEAGASEQDLRRLLAGRRVGIFAERFPPQVGGVATSVARFCRELRARGAGVDIINRTDTVRPGLLETEVTAEGSLHRFGVMAASEDTMQMLEALVLALHREAPFDLFHAFWAVPSGHLAAFIGKQVGVPAYVSIRGNDIDRAAYSARQFPFLLWTLSQAEAVSTVSRELQAKARILSGREDVEYVPNSVDCETFRPVPPHPEAQKLRADGSRLVGFVGELRYKKGMPALLEGFRRYRETAPAKLLLIGDLRRADRPMLREFLHAFPALATEIVQVPYVHDREELAAYYCALDLVVSPSLWEGMPNTVLEAMACGRVVLATRAGGVPDVIEHDRNGFLIDCAQLDSLHEAIAEILALPESRRANVGALARRRIEEGFSPGREFRGHAAIYARLISDGISS